LIRPPKKYLDKAEQVSGDVPEAEHDADTGRWDHAGREHGGPVERRDSQVAHHVVQADILRQVLAVEDQRVLAKKGRGKKKIL
jgi:hypothetical protein